MQYIRLGRTGLKVSRLCLGTMTFGWSTDAATSERIMDEALAAGINFFDTADVYTRWVEGNQGGESETIIGHWLRGKPRHELILATKVRGRMWAGVNGEGLSRHHIIKACEDSLRRLQTDYIDLYQTHSPDPETPLDETLAALDSLVQAGKVRYVGCSNYPAWLLMKALWTSDAERLVRYDCLQPHYSIFHRQEFERELALACLDQEVGVIPYSPLAAGFATGKYTRANRNPETTRGSSRIVQSLVNNEAAYALLDVMGEVAAAHEATITHVALAWLMAKPSITAPIIGARIPEQLHEALGASNLSLSAHDLSRLDAASAVF